MFLPLVFIASHSYKKFFTFVIHWQGWKILKYSFLLKIRLPPLWEILFFYHLFSYLNQQTGESRVEKYKGQEPAWVEQIKICGDDTGKQPLQKACIMLRIEVICTIQTVVLRAAFDVTVQSD